MFIDSGLRRACAVLGIKLTHTHPGRPPAGAKSKGSSAPCGISSWSRSPPPQSRHHGGRPGGAERAVHRLGRDRSTTSGCTARPDRRRWPGSSPPGPPVPTPAAAAARGVPVGGMADRHQDRDGQPARQPLRGRPRARRAKVELVFDPFDLTDISVRHHGRPAGQAIPHKIGRHVHPKAAPTPHRRDRRPGSTTCDCSRTGSTRALGERPATPNSPNRPRPSRPVAIDQGRPRPDHPLRTGHRPRRAAVTTPTCSPAAQTPTATARRRLEVTG